MKYSPRSNRCHRERSTSRGGRGSFISCKTSQQGRRAAATPATPFRFDRMYLGRITAWRGTTEVGEIRKAEGYDRSSRRWGSPGYYAALYTQDRPIDPDMWGWAKKKFFSNSQYGGARQALAAAKKWVRSSVTGQRGRRALPSRAEELAAAWRHSREELLRGRIGSLEAAKERRMILREAEDEGLLDEVVALTTGAHTRDLDAWGRPARGRRAAKGPSGKPVKTVKRGKTRYALYSNGELWVMGRDGFMAGHVMNPENIEDAIDAHEEEMAELMAQARAEFGF